MQTFGVLEDLMKYHYHIYSLLLDGANRQTEAHTLEKGINIIVAMPEQLLDHLQNTPDFFYDRILDIGYEEQLKSSIFFPNVGKLSSSALTHKVAMITKLALKKSDKRFLLLFTFLKKNKKKVMVFFNSCISVKYYHELLNYIDLPAMNVHLEKLISKNYSTKEAFKDYVRAYYSHYLEQIFYFIENLDLAKVAKSFGFIVPPAIDLKISKSSRLQKRLSGGGYGHFKNINDPSSAKWLKRIKIFRQLGKRGQDNR
ncbi:DDX18 helicase, partial [Acromyrmex insinuator]